jgi:hypothetical protein
VPVVKSYSATQTRGAASLVTVLDDCEADGAGLDAARTSTI